MNEGMSTDINGRRALVTGAGEGGLGYWAALALARAGADVAVMEQVSGSERAEQTATAIRKEGRRCEVLLADVSNETEVNEQVEVLLGVWESVDILLNAAGVMLRKAAVDTSIDEWQHVVQVNLTGTWLVSRAVAPSMLRQQYGRIVNVTSQYAAIAGPLAESAYYASKGGVANLTRGLAAEWSAGGVTVNCLAPGVFYPTAMTSRLSDEPGRLDWMKQRTMVGRLGDPAEDLGGPVVFLASEASRYVTGSVLHVDGGWSAW